MSWLFSQALVEASSAGTSWDGEPSAQLNVMPTQHKFWRNDKTMEPSDLSRFGLTSAVLTADRGEAVLTWCLEDSLARTSPSPAKVQASTAPAAECGTTWRASLAKFDPATSSWRTAQPSLLADWGESSVTWPRSGMTAGGLCWELPMSAPRINATGFGLWPTSVASDTSSRTVPYAQGGTPLSLAVKWPTPTCGMAKHVGLSPEGSQRELERGIRAGFGASSLAIAVQTNWATPLARDYKSGKFSQDGKAHGDGQARGKPLSEQIGGSLNPPWVEWLMGWPIGWTDLKPLATDRCPPALQPRGECSLEVEA